MIMVRIKNRNRRSSRALDPDQETLKIKGNFGPSWLSQWGLTLLQQAVDVLAEVALGDARLLVIEERVELLPFGARFLE